MADPEWIAAGARAVLTCGTDEEQAESVISAVEPLIRADEQERERQRRARRLGDRLDPRRMVAEADLRAQIAAEIEAQSDRFGSVNGFPTIYVADAARIARGGESHR